MTRLAVAQLPDGEFSFEDWIDDDGVDYGKPIRLFCTVRKAGDRIVVDWTGCAPQVKGAINATLSFTKAVSYTAVKSIISQDVPPNEGVFRAIEVVAPPGTIANLVPPAACAARGLTGFRMLDCALGALAMMVPDKVSAASDGGNTGVSIGGYYPDGRPYVYVDFVCSAWGGRPWSDGLDGNANLFGNIGLQSAELTEAETPVQVACWEFIPDRAGPGKFRGGAPVRRELRVTEDQATVQVRSDRRTVLPYGLYGGQPGEPSMSWHVTAGGVATPIASKFTMVFARGESLVHETAGGGGWGDPLDRDPAKVLRDVRNELVSPGAAEADYGVVMDTSAWTVDMRATQRRRDALRHERTASETPKVTRSRTPGEA
jgi:N-methylhydantoinase B